MDDERVEHFQFEHGECWRRYEHTESETGRSGHWAVHQRDHVRGRHHADDGGNEHQWQRFAVDYKRIEHFFQQRECRYRNDNTWSEVGSEWEFNRGWQFEPEWGGLFGQ